MQNIILFVFLQLMAPEAGTSFLYTDIQIGADMEWEFYFLMDFSPSGSNKTTVYLMMDNTDPDQANGYGITVGESGAFSKNTCQRFRQ